MVVGLLYDLGRPDRLWHPLVMWNPHSVMFEVAWCVTLYTTVLFLEFLPMVFEKFGMHKPLEWIHNISVPLMILGVLLSTLHQSSLGTLFLIVPEKLYPLWYTPMLPLLFFISAIAVGLAMTIFESWHSSRAFGRALELPLLASMARVLAVVLSVYLWIRFLDLAHRDVLGLLLRNRIETWLFALEIALMAGSHRCCSTSRGSGCSPGALYACAVMVVFGFIANRLNVGITGHGSRVAARTTFPSGARWRSRSRIVAAGFRDLPRDRRSISPFSRRTRWSARARRMERNGGGLTSRWDEPVRTDNPARDLAAKLAVCVIASTAAFFALFGIINLRVERRHSQELVEQSADRITDVILRSTRYEMLHNDRDALHNIIQELGSEPGIQRIRIFNKDGRITFSTDAGEVGTVGGQERRSLLRLPRAIGAARQAEPARPRAHVLRQAGPSACSA